ncbi:MAG: endonuclease [Paludibacteraceae bacterium]|nr:endonuclease [Paludibacteraceae bacterium]
MKTIRYILTLVLSAWCAWGTLYAVEKSYYNSVDGKSGSALREALTTLTYTKHTTDLGYNWTFDGIDIVNGEILDIYSTCSWTSSQQGKSYSDICDSYNREHVVPQSAFNEAAPQKSDRHHLFLADGLVNNLRSSYPFGETNVTNAFNGYDNGNKALGKLGASSSGYSGTVYEPDDEYKGDIARAVLYMAVRYATSDVCRKYGGSANSYPVTTWDNAMFSGNLSTNYGLSNNAIAVFLKWHRADPVSAKEVARNNGVEKKQGNRNPFIDLPDLVEYLWGNHAGETVDLSSLSIATGGGSVPTTYEVTLNRNGAEQTITCSGSYTLPTSSTEADACDGWAFAGWSANSSVNTTTAPTYTTSVSSATTLYAVYSHSEAASAPKWAKMATVDDVLDYALIGVVSNANPAYANWSGKTSNSSAVYAGNSAGGNTAIQLRSNNSNSGIVTTTSGGTATKVIVTWNSNTTNGRSIDIYGNSTAYSSAADLYNTSTQGTKIGSITKGTTTLNIEGNYAYIGIRSNSGALYLDDITITWSTSGGGGSTTTYMTSPSCGDPHSITLSSGGSVMGGTFEANATSAYAGATVTLYAEPSNGYIFGSWTVTNNSTSAAISVTNNQFTMPDANVTVSATFTALPTYNIKFYNNGTQIGSTQSVYQGGIPDVPVIESCEGYTFVGWWTESLASTNITAKSWIEDFTATANKDYYAVFEHTTGGGASSNESVTFSDRYTSDTEVEGTKITIGSHASVTFTKRSGGTNSKYYASGNAIRWYGGGKCVVESDAGNITAITFTFGSSDGSNTISADVGTYSSGSWTGESSLVTFTQSGTSNNRRIAGIAVTIGGGGTTYYTSTTECASACTKLGTPSVTATPGNEQITLTWVDVADADHYTVTIGTGVGYTTECGSAASIGTITHSGTTNTCIITGLTNGLTYTTNVVANASSSTCDSDADSDSATPQDCTPWDDPALSWNQYSLNTTPNKTATKSLSGETHGTLSFESSNTDVLTVDGSTGMVTAVGAGEATVIAHWTAADGYCEKTMTSSTFEVAGPLTISFDANGGTGTMTDQTVTYNLSAAIKDNAFSREGYSFIGWATSAEGEKVYNDKQSVAFTNSQTLYAKWQLNSHNVSFTPSPTGATITINGQSTSPQTAEYGTTVTLHITPAEHYTITSVSIQGATSLTEITQTGSGETRTFTMPDENVTVSVTMGAESTYTATFYNSGTQYGEAQTGYADDDITAPVTTPEACDESFTFVGWVAAEQTSETTTKPEVLTFPQTMPAGNISFYALYRRVEGSGGGEASVIFKTASSDSGTDRTEDSAIKENLVESYTGISSFSASRAYLGKYGVKLGASGGAGYITLNLSSPITTNTITVNASRYGTDTGDLEMEVNGSNSFGSALSPADGTLTFTNASEVEISDLTISTTTKRAYIASISLGGGGTSYYTTAPECTPCDYQVTLTKGAESHGTFTLNKADGTYDNCKTNFIVTVSGITPDDGYYCSGVTATGGSHAIVAGPDGSGNYTVSYTKGNTIATTITANFEPNPTYAVTWSMDGDESTKVYYEEGQEIAFPTSATGCEDKTFMGWTATAIANPQAEAPTYVTSATMGTSPITYYAVYAEEDEGGSGEIAKTTSIAVGDVVYLVYEEDKYELNGISTTSTKYGIGTSYTSTPNKLYPLEVVNGNAEGSVAFKNNDSYLNYSGSNNTLNKNATLSDNTSWTVTFSGGNAIIKNVNNTSRTIRWNSTSGQERFACYTSGMQPVQLYKSSTSYTNYTTTCGAGISAKNIGWITAAKGQKVKRVINVTAKGFDAATTLTATSGDAQFKATLAASAVPAGKTGLSTTLTVEYTPTASDNRTANVEIVLTAGGITRTITVSGRSLPDEFLAITKKSDTWYALPANMNGGENQYAGVVVTPNDASEPTSVAVASSTIVYSLHSAANSRYAENGAYVRLAGNGIKALWGNTAADALTIQNSETIDLANAENYEWSLTTTDGIHYTIANPHHADYSDGRVLAYGDKFGLYKTSTVFFLVPAGCNSQPQEVNVSARRADATFSWVSNASSVTIDLYTDEGKTAFAKSATATSVPYYMTGLEESTHYWFTLTPEGETACAVSGDFETSGPTIDVVEWKEDTVVIFVDKDTEFNPSVVIDGEVEHGAGTGAVATDIFFSKYFEAAASVKLLAVFNGTNANVDLSDYSLSIATNGGTFSHTKFEDIVKKDNTYLTAGELLLESGEELILITYFDTDNDNAIIKCAKEDEENSGFSKYVRIKTPSLEFNGNDVIALKNPSNEFIDLIGASAGSSGDLTNIAPCSGVGVSGCDFMDSPGGWYNEHGYQDKGTNAEEGNYALATNRCLLIRRNHVTTGRTAVERNTTDFVTLGDYTYEAVNYQGEWKGVQIPGGTSSTTDDGIVNACTGFEHVGGFNYSEYYKGYETIETQTLDSYTHDEATKTYEIPIPDLAKYSCLNIRFQLKNTAGEVVTEAPVQVPIIVKDGHTTIDAIFNEIVKTDGGDPLYDESIKRCKTCDVVVLGTGVLTKATDGSTNDVPEVGNVKVYPGGKLIVPTGTSYSVNSLAFRRQEDEVSTANIQGDLTIKAAGNNVYLDLRIDPSNWHYISLPYNCNVSDIRFADDEVKIPVLGVDYLLKYYDGKKRAATQAGGCWEMVAADATLKKGIGYIFGIPGSGSVQREFRFPMSNAVVSEEKESTKLANGVYAFGGDKDMTEVRANHRGWNLIGDPYLLPYTSDIEEPVMTGYIVPDYSTDPWDGHYKFDPAPSTNLRYIVEPVDNGRSEYIQVAITDYNMKPFTSYFVQIGGSDPEAEQGVQFNLSKVKRSASPVRRAPAAYEEQEDTHPVWCAVNITSPKGETDETTMLISDQFTDGYDMMDDLVKMRGTYYQYAQITTKPVLASRNNEGEMAFNALPDASAEAGIPLHYFAATQGEYVLAYSDKYGRDEVKAVMLLDKQTNEWHDLMNAPYEFYTNRTDDKDRFVLTIRVERKNGPQITTDIDAASSADDRPRKILHKDHIYILRGDKIYDITGKEL